jgi:hypothetical protein
MGMGIGKAAAEKFQKVENLFLLSVYGIYFKQKILLV